MYTKTTTENACQPSERTNGSAFSQPAAPNERCKATTTNKAACEHTGCIVCQLSPCLRCVVVPLVVVVVILSLSPSVVVVCVAVWLLRFYFWPSENYFVWEAYFGCIR